MSAYKPRAGTFRKVKYPLKIYKTNEIPVEDVKDVLNMVEKIKTEETLDCPQYQFDEPEECKDRLSDLIKKKSPKLENLKLSPESIAVSRSLIQPKVLVPKVETVPLLPEAQFSLVPDSLYNQCYADDDSLPPFPVFSSEISFSDAEESGRDSEYDMDTEDEDWLEANDKFNITPNRLEYIFSKLNKRNTHVEKKAIGALPEAFHIDFYHLFPYWKEKRLQNKNVSSFKPKINETGAKKDARLSGYITTDPYVIFACNPRKSLPQQTQQHPSQLKVSQKLNKQGMKTYLKRMLETREKLANVRDWASETFHSSVDDRNEIVNNFATLMQNQGTSWSGKENPDTKFAARCNNKAKSVKSSSIPVKVSGRLTTHTNREKVNMQETSLNSVRMKVALASHPSKKTAPVILELQEKETRLIRKKKQRKLPTFKRGVFNGTWKTKGNINDGRYLRIQAAMP